MVSRRLVFSVVLKDCEVDTYRNSKGAGGQHRDKTSSAVRIRHLPSGAVRQCQEHREQHRNKKIAFRRMAESVKFQTWARVTAMGLRPIDEIVDEQMENVTCEQSVDGRWIECQ